MGRAARGPGDYCVVIVMGKDLVSWLGKEANLRFLTTSTYSQLEMGIEISKNISDSKDFMNTINRSFKREKEWVTYHAETLADLTFNIAVKKEEIDRAEAERQGVATMARWIPRAGNRETDEAMRRSRHREPGARLASSVRRQNRTRLGQERARTRTPATRVRGQQESLPSQGRRTER